MNYGGLENFLCVCVDFDSECLGKSTYMDNSDSECSQKSHRKHNGSIRGYFLEYLEITIT